MNRRNEVKHAIRELVVFYRYVRNLYTPGEIPNDEYEEYSCRINDMFYELYENRKREVFQKFGIKKTFSIEANDDLYVVMEDGTEYIYCDEEVSNVAYWEDYDEED